jgi:hypothetical protein
MDSFPLQDVWDAFKEWTKEYQYPNVLFKLSLADTHRCYYKAECAAPILSPAKRVGCTRYGCSHMQAAWGWHRL